MTGIAYKCRSCSKRGRTPKKIVKCPMCEAPLKKKADDLGKVNQRIDDGGYKLKKVTDGWTFVEPSKHEGPTLTREEGDKIDACARRRGLIRSSHIYIRPDYGDTDW